MPPALRLQSAVSYLKSVYCWQRQHWNYRVPDIPFSMLLEIAKKAEGISHKALLLALPCSTPTAIKWLKRLDQDGWIVIAGNGSDKRSRYITLTDKAEQYLIDYWRAQRKRIGVGSS